MNKQPLLTKIRVAKQELREAEADREALLRELKVSKRADKAMLGKALDCPFSKVKLATSNLLVLEKLIEAAL